MRCYISLPIKDKEDTVKSRYEKAVAMLNSNGIHDVTGPHNIDEFDYNGYFGDTTLTWEHHLVRDLDEIDKCDAILMTDGWKYSPGCRLELEYAEYHGKIILYTDGSI